VCTLRAFPLPVNMHLVQTQEDETKAKLERKIWNKSTAEMKRDSFQW